MITFALFVTIITSVQSRPGGYVYSPTIPSGIVNTYDTFGSTGLDNGANLGTVSINSIGGNHGINGEPLYSGIGLTSAAVSSSSTEFSGGSFTSGNGFSSGGSFQHGTSFSTNGGNLQGGLSGGTGIGSNDIHVKGSVFDGGPGTLVQKHIYVHVPPSEPDELHARRPISVAPVQKHYKIIFIKAPTAPSPTAPVIPVQSQIEEKTLVYVLIKRPDEQPDVHIPVPTPTQPSKPEVYFIRYKAQKDVGGAGSGVILNGEASNRGTDNKIISSSVSSSSHSQSSKISSSSISTSYGPPTQHNGY